MMRKYGYLVIMIRAIIVVMINQNQKEHRGGSRAGAGRGVEAIEGARVGTEKEVATAEVVAGMKHSPTFYGN